MYKNKDFVLFSGGGSAMRSRHGFTLREQLCGQSDRQHCPVLLTAPKTSKSTKTERKDLTERKKFA